MEEWLRPLLESEGFEFVDAQVSRTRGALRLRIFVDREEGLGIDDLARLSRRIGLLLDAEPGMAGAYELEVSSPGMNRAIWTERHFERFAGERVHLWIHEPNDGRRHFEGTILGVADGEASIDIDGQGPTRFALNRIERAELRLDPRRRPRGIRSEGERGPNGVSDHGE
ncbi:MAG: ribosome maturation factor RimP [Candidatus Eisenbacteria bacterium]|nr:ribosome maturation factor RimP [Candidatus Eisenbacteria bacterium]